MGDLYQMIIFTKKRRWAKLYIHLDAWKSKTMSSTWNLWFFAHTNQIWWKVIGGDKERSGNRRDRRGQLDGANRISRRKIGGRILSIARIRSLKKTPIGNPTDMPWPLPSPQKYPLNEDVTPLFALGFDVFCAGPRSDTHRFGHCARRRGASNEL